MNHCRTDNPEYHHTPDFDYSDADERADDARKQQRRDEFWDIFCHGDKKEALNMAENIMLMDEDLYNAVLETLVMKMAKQQPETALGKQADKSARNYMNDCIDDGSDTWSKS